MPQYPALPAKTDPSKIEEIRRTIYVSNLDPMVCITLIVTVITVICTEKQV